MTTAEAAKNEAMASADAGADTEWKEAVELVIRAICSGLDFGGTFTTDLVWEYMEMHFPGITTPEPKAMGPMMARMARLKLIEKTNMVQDSTRVECHARPVAIWKITTFSADYKD